MLFNVHTSVPVWLRHVRIVCHIPFMTQGKRVQLSPAMEFGAKLPNSLEHDLPSTRPCGFLQEPRHHTFRIFWFSTFQEVAAKLQSGLGTPKRTKGSHQESPYLRKSTKLCQPIRPIRHCGQNILCLRNEWLNSRSLHPCPWSTLLWIPLALPETTLEGLLWHPWVSYTHPGKQLSWIVLSTAMQHPTARMHCDCICVLLVTI